ncbi:serine hydrolase domain-containing protein [Metabacillus arenae]|uniref:Serine hydrolase n=1 Tax=Metabacillus arenae TaxID=2771434 RepID=A0A926NHV1_9BACI|nr:serine hydrolase [Metabacillus arenae]MBD1381075.1 serine hydrolase [Metabacillus arenae]
MNKKILSVVNEAQESRRFSGTTLIKQAGKAPVISSRGYANRAEQLPNKPGTRYGIASGCKLFTAIAICQLVEEGKIAFDTKLSECIEYELPNFSENITIHHLLTHTSGVPDYFDEEVMDDFEDLWRNTPMYTIRHVKDFLPFFENDQMKFTPGKQFHYNNTGYILLGLIVEKVSGLQFIDYIEENIFKKANMVNSGYFAFDSLPPKTAQGYIDFVDGTWKTNIYSLPVRGGSDGGAYITVEDMVLLWEALLKHKLLSEPYTKKLLTPHVNHKDKKFYGYGVWINQTEGTISKYHIMGYDPGVSFHSAYYPSSQTILVVCSNASKGAFNIMEEVEKYLNGRS